MKMNVITLEGKQAGSVDLSDAIFGLEVRKDILHRVVNWQQAKRRAGNANTKTRAEISRTGSKLVRQKGTGGARHGSRRVVTFVGGGVVHGPRPRDFGFDLPKQVRRLGLKIALSAKAKDNKLVVIDEAKLSSPKTKEFAAKLKGLDLENALFLVDSSDQNFDLASRNMPFVKVLPTQGANVFDILRADKLVLTKTAVSLVEARINGSN